MSIGKFNSTRVSIIESTHTDVTLLGYNIDTNMARSEEGIGRDCYPALRANARAPLVKDTVRAIIDSDRPNVVNIQECRRFVTKFGDEVDSISSLLSLFKEKRYSVVQRSYNEAGGDKAFQFLTAYDREALRLKGAYMRYFTKTPTEPTPRPDTSGLSAAEASAVMQGIKEHNFGSEWERGVLVTRFQHKYLVEPFFSINVHLDIPEAHRLKAAEMIREFLIEIIAEHPTAKIVIEGDFNTFPDRGGPEQLEILNGATFEGEKLLNEATQHLVLPSGEPAAFSFIAFTHDFIGIVGRDVHGMDIGRIIEGMSWPDQQKMLVLDGLANSDNGSFNVVSFLATLGVPQRKDMIRSIFSRCPAVAGKLDRVFYRGLDEMTRCELRPAATCDTSAITSFNNDDEVHHYIQSNDGVAPFASDHQPVLTTFSCQKTADHTELWSRHRA